MATVPVDCDTLESAREAMQEAAVGLGKFAEDLRQDTPNGRAARVMLDRATAIEAEDPERASYLRQRAAEILA